VRDGARQLLLAMPQSPAAESLAFALEVRPGCFPPALLGLAAATCRACRTQALANARSMAEQLGEPVSSQRAAAKARLPRGIFARLRGARLLEGLVVALGVCDLDADAGADDPRGSRREHGLGFAAGEADWWCDRLRALGAVVVPPPCIGTLHAWVYGSESAGPAAAAAPPPPRLDFWVSATAHVAPVPSVPCVWAALLQMFLVSPWKTVDTQCMNGQVLSHAELLEVTHGYREHFAAAEGVTTKDVEQWSAHQWSSVVPWQDLSLRTHLNLRTGDRVREWNYGMGDNDFGTYHFVPASARASSAFPNFVVNRDGERSLVAGALVPAALTSAQVDALVASGSVDERVPRVADSKEKEEEEEEEDDDDDADICFDGVDCVDDGFGASAGLGLPVVPSTCPEPAAESSLPPEPGTSAAPSRDDDSLRVYAAVCDMFAARGSSPQRVPPLCPPQGRWPQDWSHAPINISPAEVEHGAGGGGGGGSATAAWREHLQRVRRVLTHGPSPAGDGAASVVSFVAAVLTESTYVTSVLVQEILRRNGRG
jgi:hypothetical protein